MLLIRTARPLTDLSPGATAVVASLTADPVLRRGWWSGPLHVRVGMTELMVRRRDAACMALAA